MCVVLSTTSIDLFIIINFIYFWFFNINHQQARLLFLFSFYILKFYNTLNSKFNNLISFSPLSLIWFYFINFSEFKLETQIRFTTCKIFQNFKAKHFKTKFTLSLKNLIFIVTSSYFFKFVIWKNFFELTQFYLDCLLRRIFISKVRACSLIRTSLIQRVSVRIKLQKNSILNNKIIL